MFEGIVSKILVKVLGDYIEDIDSQNLRLGLLAGDVQLKQLKMKSTALDAFDLPITVVWGYVGTIKASIPWKSLGTSPVTLDISDIYIVVQPRKCVAYDPEIEKERLEKSRIARLHNYEFHRMAHSLSTSPSHAVEDETADGADTEAQERKTAATDSESSIGETVSSDEAASKTETTTAVTPSEEKKDTSSFVDRLTETIINNIQIRVHNVRVRYEDDSDPNMPIIFGLNLEDVSVVSCDENWKESWVKGSQEPMYKKAMISGLSMYSEKTTDLLFSKIENLDQFQEQMKQFIAEFSQHDNRSITSLLEPTDANLKAILQRNDSLDMTKPKLALELLPGNVSLSINDKQYMNILRVIDYVTNYSRFERFRSIRPEEAFYSSENRMNSEEKRKKWWKYAILAANKNMETQYFSWEDVQRKRELRNEYIELYKRSKASFKRKLDAEENERLDFLERTMPTTDVIFARESAEAQLKIELQRYKKHKESLPKRAASWLTSWFTPAHDELDEESLGEIEVTDEERKQLELDIGYSISTSGVLETPPDFVELLFSVILCGQVELIDSEFDKVIVRGSLTDLNVSVGARANASSFIITTSIGSVSLKDEFTTNTQFPDIIAKVEEGKKLVDVSIEANPLHKEEDLIVDVSIAGVEIIANLALLQRILAFFIIPSDVDLEELQKVLQMQLEELQRFATLQLQIALQNKYIISINLSLNAPTFLIPEDPTDKSKPVLVIDLGQLVMSSEPTDKARDDRIKESKLEEKDFYDHYIVELSHVSATLYSNYDQDKIADTLVHDLSFTMVFSALIATNTTYPAFALDSKLPLVNISISPKKVSHLSGIINNIFDFIDNPVGIQKSMIQKSGYVELNYQTKATDIDLPEKKQYLCDLRIDGTILLYDSEERGKPAVYVGINRLMQVVSSSDNSTLNRNEFGLIVSTKTNDILFIFKLENEETANEWYDIIRAKLLDIVSVPTTRVIPNKNNLSITDAIQPNQQVVQLRATFVLEELCLNIVHTRKESEVPLVALIVTNFAINVQSRSYDTTIDMKLQQITVSEFTRSISKPQPLLYSGNKGGIQQNIAEAKILITSDERSEFYSENSDVVVNVEFSKFTLHFDPYVVSVLIRKVFEFIELSQLFVSRTLSYQPVRKQIDEELHDRNIVVVRASLARAAMILEDQSSKFISLSMKNTCVSLSMDDKAVIIDGRIGDLTAKGHTSDSKYREIMGLTSKGGSLVDFTIRQDLLTVETTPYYPTHVKVILSSIQFVYVQSTINHFISYIMDGPLLPTIQEVTTNFQTKGEQNSVAHVDQTVASQSLAQISLDITLLNPLIIIPENSMSSDKLIANLGKITVTNSLNQVSNHQNEEINWTETIVVSLQDTNIQTELLGKREKVLNDTNFEIDIVRPIIDEKSELPQVCVVLNVQEQFSMEMNHAQYESMFRIIYQNFMAETPTENRRAQLSALMSERHTKEQETVDEEQDRRDKVSVQVNVSLVNINLTILKSVELMDPEPIARLDMHNLNVNVTQMQDGSTGMTMFLPKIDAFDLRNNKVKQFVESKTHSSDEPLIHLLLDLNPVKNVMHINLQLGSPEMIVDPPLIMDITNYFSSLPIVPQQSKKERHSVQFNNISDIVIGSNVFLGEDIYLSLDRKLQITSKDSNEIIIDGQGHIIDFDVTSPDEIVPLIYIAPGISLIFKNTILRHSDNLDQLIHYGDENSVVSAPTTLNVFTQKLTKDQHLEIKQRELEVGGIRDKYKKPDQMRTVFQGEFGSPVVLIPVSPEKDTTRYFVLEGQLSVNIDMKPVTQENIYECFLNECRLYNRSDDMGTYRKSANILEPVSISFKMKESVHENELIRAISINIKDSIFARVSYNDVKSVLKITQSFTQSQEDSSSSVTGIGRSDSKAIEDDIIVLSPGIDDVDIQDQEFREFETNVDRTELSDKKSYSDHLSSEASDLTMATPTSIVYTFDITPNLEASLRLIDDINGYDVPLLNFSIDSILIQKARMSQMGNTLDLATTVSFRVVGYFFNMKLALWEPIIEPYHAVVEYERRPTENADSPVSYMDKLILKQHDLGINQPPEPFSINVSKSMIDTVNKVQQAWTRDIETDVVSTVLDPILLRNHTGIEVLFTIQGADRPVRIAQGSEHSFSMDEHFESIDSRQKSTPILATIELPHVDIDFSLDLKSIGIKHFENKRRKIHAIVETEIEDGRRIITLRSGAKVVNDSSIMWTIASKDLSDGQLTIIGDILPGTSVGVPILEIDNGFLCIKPSEVYDWNSSSNCAWSNLMTDKSRSLLVSCPHMQEYGHSCQAVIRTKATNLTNDESREKSYTIKIEAPMVIENLLGQTVQYKLYQSVEQSQQSPTMSGELAVGAKEYIYTLDFGSKIFMRTVFDEGCNCPHTALIYSPKRSECQNKLSIMNRVRATVVINFDYSSESTSGAYHSVSLYSPYWLVNHTSKNLMLKESSGRILSHANALSSNQRTTPIMFSFTKEKDHKVALRIDDSPYSEYFSIGNVGVSDYLMVTSPSDMNYCIGFTVQLATGKFNRTKIVTISPRYIFQNLTSSDIHVKQVRTSEECVLQSQKISDYYWHGHSISSPELMISIPSVSLDWSSPFILNSLGDMSVKMMNQEDPNEINWKMLNINLSERGGSILVKIEDQNQPPYIIENRLNIPIKVSQYDIDKWWEVRENNKLDYAWDNLIAPQNLIVLIDNNEIGPIDINKVTGVDTELAIHDNQMIFISVHTNDGTRVLRVDTNRYYDKSAPFRKVKPIEKSKKRKRRLRCGSRDVPPSPEEQPQSLRLEPANLKDEEFSLFVYIDLPSIGFSLIDDKLKREIAYVYMEDLLFRFEQTNKNQYIEFTMTKAQIDNQLLNCVYPVVLYNEESKEKAFIHFSACRAMSDQNALLFRYLSVAMQKMHLRIEYAFVETLISLVSSLLESDMSDDQEVTEKMMESIQTLNTSTVGGIAPSEAKFYFDTFELHPIRIYLSFLFNRAEEDDDDFASKAERKRLLSAATSAGFTMAKIEGAPISASSLILKHPFVTQSELIEKIKKHYIRQVTYDFYKIIGSLDLIGNPIGLFNDLNTGIKEFFYDPADALIHRPEEFSSELADGSLKLVSSTIHGTFNTASKLTGTLGKGINFLTFDEEYIRERERSSVMKRPKNVREGFTEGAESFAKNVLEGATGIFTKPVQGAKKEGIAGFFKGVGKGLVGIPTKPVSGLVDFATKANEGISSIGQKQVERIRYPRTFRKDGAIVPYYAPAAFSLYILSRAEDGKYYKDGEQPIVHITDSDNATLFMLTQKALYGISLRDNSVSWRFPLETILSANIRQDSNGRNVIVVTAPQPKKYRQVLQRGTSVSKTIHNPSQSQLTQFHASLSSQIDQVRALTNQQKLLQPHLLHFESEA